MTLKVLDREAWGRVAAAIAAHPDKQLACGRYYDPRIDCTCAVGVLVPELVERSKNDARVTTRKGDDKTIEALCDLPEVRTSPVALEVLMRLQAWNDSLHAVSPFERYQYVLQFALRAARGDVATEDAAAEINHRFTR